MPKTYGIGKVESVCLTVKVDRENMKKAYYFPVFFFLNKVNQLSILSFFQISSALTLHELPQGSGAMPNRGCGQYQRRADMPTHLADKVGYHFDLLKRERTQMLWKVAKEKKIAYLKADSCWRTDHSEVNNLSSFKSFKKIQAYTELVPKR